MVKKAFLACAALTAGLCSAATGTRYKYSVREDGVWAALGTTIFVR